MSKLGVVERVRELVVRTAGALPVVKALCDRLGLVEAADRFCPIRSVADYTRGQVVEALVCNRFTHPRPLSSFTDWGERFAVEETPSRRTPTRRSATGGRRSGRSSVRCTPASGSPRTGRCRCAARASTAPGKIARR